MKRGRSKSREESPSVASETKKAKWAVGEEKEVGEKAVAEQKEAVEGVPVVKEAVEWDEWWVGLWDVVDEEMPWATSCSWCPFWEMEAAVYDSLYGDVLWDYDIWNLKTTTAANAPNP